MPATSKVQQRLMGMAYAYKKGELDPNEASQEVKDLADSMTLKQLKDFASTKHDGLPEVKENITPASINGMGAPAFPTQNNPGSGDVPAGSGDAEEEYKKRMKKIKKTMNFESFINSKTQTTKKVNEEFIELPSLSEPADDLIDAFKQWYRDTDNNWEDFKEDMAEDSIDEAAKNAQMEILVYLSNKMNDIIKDRKFKVNADFR
jgi:hypothetical protein